jgi:Protein of unknown function (DUF1761)
METNWIVVFSCSLIPLLVGFIWYSNMLFGKAWMQASGMTIEKSKEINMPKVMGLALLMGAFISTAMLIWTVHQMGFNSVFQGEADQALLKDPNSALSLYIKDFFEKYGKNFRTFKHGAFHGVIAGIFLALPIITMSALWEKRSFKYVAIHTGFWMVCLALIGGIICQWS